VLLALLLGRPVVSISYNEKNDALMTEMGLARYCQPIEGFDVGRLMDQFRSLEQEGPRLRSAVSEKCARYRDELEEQYVHVFRAV
jgi:polysaccharide pyruvyl transferase WcaK-like protein